MVNAGDKISSATLYEHSPENKVDIAELIANKKVIIFGVPGAFTPGCSKTHVPGFITNADSLKADLKVSEIICVAVNDAFVMQAWSEQLGAEGKVRMLADPKGEFASALGLSMNIEPLGGQRYRRFSMVVENGVIAELNVEPDGVGLTCSLADHIRKKP